MKYFGILHGLYKFTRAFVESVKYSKYFIFKVFLKFPLKYLNLRDVFGSKILHKFRPFAFLKFKTSKNTSFGILHEVFVKYSLSKITSYFDNSKHFTFLFETDGHCHQMSFLLSENREVYGGFCQDYAATQFDAEREKRVTKC